MSLCRRVFKRYETPHSDLGPEDAVIMEKLERKERSRGDSGVGLISRFVIAACRIGTAVVFLAAWSVQARAATANWIPRGLDDVFVDVLAIDPTDSNTLYAVVSPGFETTKKGLYKTTDGGVTWFGLGIGLQGVEIRALAIDPNNPRIVFAGTDTGAFSSGDGGVSWHAISAGMEPFEEITAIVVDPSDSKTLYAGGSTVSIYKSTDRGFNWSPADDGFPSTFNVVSLAISATDPATLYASTSNSGVAKTTDGAQSWHSVSNGLEGLFDPIVAVDPSDADTAYVAGGTEGVFKTIDGGQSWTAVNNGIDTGFALGVQALAIDPSHPSTIYAGADVFQAVLMTSDAASAWSSIGPPEADVSALAISASNPNLVYAATSRGVFVMENASSGGGGGCRAASTPGGDGSPLAALSGLALLLLARLSRPSGSCAAPT
jgi:photosystem II stability/assembly factor-like uncharacterized protein